ncbi:MAG: c-type cytochrome [Halieaceae bacterium]
MKKLLIGLSLLLGLSAHALAGDAVAGKDKSLMCSACHGADGNSMVPSFPKLAGQNQRYLIKQMNDIKNGARPVPTMVGQLDAMSEADIADIAAFYASQNASGGQADPATVALGAGVYRAGVSASGVAACAACHGARGGGNAPAGFPALAGQHPEYIADQLRRFRTGAENTLAENPAGRTNDGDARMMRDVAYRLTDNEIAALSNFIAGLH